MTVNFKKSETLKDLMHIFADLLENNKLFISDVTCKWMCLNCGHVIEATQAPAKCPV